ncbi:MAG: 4-(cytidine 5'-diphospho)-2-C-methyl-D-erythritol kinase [Bifidobacteriaceae bacterium]|jgi:4-diphosphocytidyl-2-C-methyl-D-erythritol kinase|nr:4-(cytidine 5'-diphospho)-2-C-methyl-D-erythritol kinase [Bifidobacteriaceae bacterium]
MSTEMPDVPRTTDRPKVVSGAPTSEFQATASYLELHAPAKTNFALNVGERGTLPRSAREGTAGCRHYIDTVYCSVGIYDDVDLTLKRRRSGFSLDLEGANLGDLASDDADMRSNLAVKALFALAEHSGKAPDVGIRIFKRIPVAAGLGSGAADAAAVLVGLNRLWHLDYSLDQLRDIATPLGHGIPFCLTGGLLVGSNYGEAIEPVTASMAKQLGPELNFTTMLLGTYNQGLSKAAVYAELDRQRAEAAKLAEAGKTEDEDTAAAGHGSRDLRFGHNDLEPAVISLFPRAGAALEDAAAAAEGITTFVSGSGPTVVACLPDPKAMWKVIGAWKASRSVDRIVRVETPAELEIS